MNLLLFTLCLISVSVFACAELHPRIVGGSFASKNQFPYLVALQVKQDNAWYLVCGAGIISEKFVLTAAHCVAERDGVVAQKRYRVVGNVTDLNNLEYSREADVKRIYVPESYFTSGYTDDIAVLEISSNQYIGLKVGLSILELPRTGQTYAGQTAKFAGYGSNWIDPDNHENGRNDLVLRYMDVKVITHDECRQRHKDTEWLPTLYDSQICGKGLPPPGNRVKTWGSCYGDSGSPLVVNNAIVGVFSLAATYHCEENYKPAIYTRVTSFSQFIDNAMKGVMNSDIRIQNVPSY